MDGYGRRRCTKTGRNEPVNAAKRTGEGCCGLRGTGGARVGGARGGRARRRDSHASKGPEPGLGLRTFVSFLQDSFSCILAAVQGVCCYLFRKFVKKVPEGGLVYDLTVHESAVCYDERCRDGRNVIQAYVW